MKQVGVFFIALTFMLNFVDSLHGEGATEPSKPKAVSAGLGIELLFYYPSDINEEIEQYVSDHTGGGYIIEQGFTEIILSFAPVIRIDYRPLSFLTVYSELQGYCSPKILDLNGEMHTLMHYGFSASGGLSTSIRLSPSSHFLIGAAAGYYWSFFEEFKGSSLGFSTDLGFVSGNTTYLLRGRHADIPSQSAETDLPFTGVGLAAIVSF